VFELSNLRLKFGEVLASLRLLFVVWRVRLMSDQSTVCMKCLLICHIIIIEHVHSWLKLDILLQTVGLHISTPNCVRACY